MYSLSRQERLLKNTINMGHGLSRNELLELELCNPNNLPSKEVRFVFKTIKTLKMKKYHGWGGRCMGRWQEIACNGIAIALIKVEKIYEDNLDSIPSPSSSVKI